MKAKKSLGQNFLKNKSVVKDVVRSAQLKSGDTVLEIGPGKGILTEELLKKVQKVIAVEKDDGLYKFLKEKFAEEIEGGRLNLVHGDILSPHLDVGRLSGYKLVSNIPYNITGEIIKRFLSGDKQPESITLLVQYEVAKRIVGMKKPFDSAQGKESILSISVKVYGNPKFVKKVSAKNFSPKPKVDSAILVIENISKDFFQDIDEEKFFKLVKAGFSQKRKMLSNTLKDIFGKKLEKTFKKAKISPDLRAEKLKTEDWKRLLKE